MTKASCVRQNTAMNNPLGDGSAGPANRGSFHNKASQSSATRGVGIERPLFPENLQPPPGFGKLSTVCDQPRGHTPRDGVHSFVLARSGAAEGTANHGIDRTNNDGFEQRTNAPLRHPEFEAYFNYEGRKFNELTAREKRQLEMAVHYPNIRNGIMRAPLYFREGSLAQPEATQSKLVSRIFGTREIFEKIFAHLIPRYEDLSSLCGASQLTARMVQSSWMHLDATGIDFLGWDQYCLTEVREMEAREETKRSTKDGQAKKARTRVFSPTVIISPVRPEDQGPARKVITNKAGYPLNSSVEAPEETSFAVSMTAHYKLLHFSYLNGYAIKHLVLHGMPWVNVAALQRIVSQMPRLEALGVHQCFLLTLADTQPFLRAVNAINKERSELTPPQPHIAADYSPFYYKGPPYKADGTGHLGEYGIVAEEKDWLDTQRAVPAQLFGIWDLCHKGHQDFFTPGTGFRAFLDRLPLRGLIDILRSIAALHDFYDNKHLSGVGVSRWCAISSHHDRDKPPLVSEELKHAMEMTVWQDLIIACNDGSMLQGRLRELLVLRGKVKLQRCRECNMHLPAYFFTANVLGWRAQDIICHGCQLGLNLLKHEWLLYRYRRDLAERIFRTENGKELSLSKVLRNIGKPARAEVKAEFGREAKPAREAIPSLPGRVDVKFLEAAQKMWEILTIGIPMQLRDVRKAVKAIDKIYDELPFKFRMEESAKREELERKELWLEFQLGINQRKSNDGAVASTCLSWEQLIREDRADIAIGSGKFVNHGPMHIFNLRANVASMLGRSGGLHEYWNVESDEESGVKGHDPRGFHNTASAGTASEAQSEESSVLGSNSKVTTTVNSSLMTLSTAGNYCGTSNRSERSSSRRARRVAPHLWKGPRVVAPALPQTPAPQHTVPSTHNVSQQKPMSYAAAASSQNAPSRQQPTKATEQPTTKVKVLHEQPAQTSPQSSKKLLPHQRRPQKTAQPVEHVPRHIQPAQATAQPPHKLLPHQRGPQKAAKPVEDVPRRTQPARTAPQPSEGLLPHQRQPLTAARAVQDVPQHTRPAQMTAHSQRNLLPHQRRPQMDSQATRTEPAAAAAAAPSQNLLPHQRGSKQAATTKPNETVPGREISPEEEADDAEFHKIL
ncbi:hypothetical protein F5B21DRAFT_524266 [Xylaria acuta]|nr:hypothetical protein F5B21DRAFT_524266 [Xylaria acuta]